MPVDCAGDDVAALVAHLLAPKNIAAIRKAREVLVGKPMVKQDALLREQLPAWFAAVRNIQNQTWVAYL